MSCALGQKCFLGNALQIDCDNYPKPKKNATESAPSAGVLFAAHIASQGALGL